MRENLVFLLWLIVWTPTFKFKIHRHAQISSEPIKNLRGRVVSPKMVTFWSWVSGFFCALLPFLPLIGAIVPSALVFKTSASNDDQRQLLKEIRTTCLIYLAAFLLFAAIPLLVMYH
jgi:ABC-type Fe3+ transport system permease subunit